MKTQTILNDYKVLLVFFFAVMLSSCAAKNFVKLDAPLAEVLPRITVIVPERQDKDGKPLEVIIGKTLKGKVEYLSDGETHELEYALLNEHVVEGKKYIVTVVSYNFGGEGRFYYLTGIDKSTLRSDGEVLLGDLGDRVKIISLISRGTEKDTVDIRYTNREQRKAFAENPHHIRHFIISWVVGPPAPPQSFIE